MSSVMVRSPQVVRERERALRCAPARRDKALAGGTRDTKQNRFQIEIVPADGTSCCLLYEAGLRYVTVFCAASGNGDVKGKEDLGRHPELAERQIILWVSTSAR
jgi:hypothetical protein